MGQIYMYLFFGDLIRYHTINDENNVCINSWSVELVDNSGTII